MSKIQWTEQTWNPIVGCSIVSPGCRDCYAMAVAHRLGKNPKTPQYHGLTRLEKGKAIWTGKLSLVPSTLSQPLSRRKPTTYFVNSMGDLFHKGLSDYDIDEVFSVMERCPQHRFQVLTKRAERMRDYMKRRSPSPHIWLGVSAERQPEWDERVAYLRKTRAAVRFVSYEPALGPVQAKPADLRDLDWIIVGGESGPTARPFNLAWARSMIAQCREAGIACFVKQLGARPIYREGYKDEHGGVGFHLMLADKKGGDMSEWPEDLRVREMPG